MGPVGNLSFEDPFQGVEVHVLDWVFVVHKDSHPVEGDAVLGPFGAQRAEGVHFAKASRGEGFHDLSFDFAGGLADVGMTTTQADLLHVGCFVECGLGAVGLDLHRGRLGGAVGRDEEGAKDFVMGGPIRTGVSFALGHVALYGGSGIGPLEECPSELRSQLGPESIGPMDAQDGGVRGKVGLRRGARRPPSRVQVCLCLRQERGIPSVWLPDNDRVVLCGEDSGGICGKVFFCVLTDEGRKLMPQGDHVVKDEPSFPAIFTGTLFCLAARW